MDKAAEVATQPIGQAWSDVSAWLGGYRPVEVTDLVIQPWYMIGNQISDDAYEVLLRNYPDLLPQLFDGRTLKREYRPLIGQPIGGFNMGWIKSLFSFLTNPIADLTGGYRERKRIAAEMAADVATAENNLKIAKFNAQARRLDKQEDNDASYDQTVLNNRRETLMDELIIVVFLGLFLAHFVPDFQPYMAAGWQAMGYSGAP